MGTGYELTCGLENVGMLPRAIRHIYSGIESRQEQAREAGLPVPEFRVEAQFIELYNESLYDLLEPDRSIQVNFSSFIFTWILLTFYLL
jgi:kinesin family member 21